MFLIYLGFFWASQRVSNYTQNSYFLFIFNFIHLSLLNQLNPFVCHPFVWSSLTIDL